MAEKQSTTHRAVCPICGTNATSEHPHGRTDGITEATFMCDGLHVWVTKWLEIAA
jgi:hypothetical protein